MLQTSLTIKIAFTFFLLWNQMTFTVGIIYFSNGHGQTPPWRKIYVLKPRSYMIESHIIIFYCQ